MKMNTRYLIQAMLAAAIASTHPLIGAQNTSAQTPDSSGASTAGGASSRGSNADTAADDAAVQNLLAASQSLREAIQRLAQTPPGERRTEAIREGNEALIKVQSAIVALPPELLLANARESDYKKAMDKMRQASDRLHAAANVLANQPAGKQRDAAVRRVNQALLETNEAMLTGLQLSAGNTTRADGATGASGSGTGSAGTSGAAGTSGDSSSGMGGSATVTGRPGGNTVDLTNESNKSGTSGETK